ncbi:multicopper oxidase family protein [Microbaculum marinum]|uniref:Multicopper oxidase family protein n=1 Tax=Microbaculum marinum TaxID=1764581 RepID=A0AAW9RSQ7_9HYPH
MQISRRMLLAGGAGLTAGALMARPGMAAGPAATPLKIDSRQIEVYGKPATRYRVVQPSGTMGLTLDEGDAFYVRLSNGIAQPSGLHWHGMTEPWRQDGVPYLSGPPIQPGGSADYLFAAIPPGTRWMHSHFGLQEQNLLGAPLIIRERAAIDSGAQEVVLFLEDFAWEPPEEIYANLRKISPEQVAELAGTAPKAMEPDLDDVTYPAFLANERTLEDPEVIDVEAGAEVRLRIINASASTNYWIDLGALQGTLVTVDGNPIEPLAVQRVPLAVAQRADVVVRVPAGAAAPVLALAEGRDMQAGIILRAPGASVAKVPVRTQAATPRVTLEQEKTLRASAPLPRRAPDRTVPVKLTGQMLGYNWQMPVHELVGLPAQATKDERVEIVFENTTMMSHPMHLHGHVFQVVEIDGEPVSGAIRDTVLVTPKSRVRIAFEADNPGIWAFHCHNLYHLASGMFTTLTYRGFG